VQKEVRVWRKRSEAAKVLGVSVETIKAWGRTGVIKTLITPKGRKVYDVDGILTQQFEERPADSRRKVCYCRVSSSGQREDLQRQREYLSSKFPGHEVISEIGSGLSFKRPRFNSLLRDIQLGNVSEVIVAHRDRLCRFGFELIESIAKFHNCKVLVLEEVQCSPEQELVRDIISIIHVFSSRLYGMRKYADKIKKDKGLPKK
jgi:predicted site-specific integrase-resolvase